jgi:hypothetical protein
MKYLPIFLNTLISFLPKNLLAKARNNSMETSAASLNELSRSLRAKALAAQEKKKIDQRNLCVDFLNRYRQLMTERAEAGEFSLTIAKHVSLPNNFIPFMEELRFEYCSSDAGHHFSW